MSAHDFDAALAEPDGHAFSQKLRHLTLPNTPCTGDSLPATAEAYLAAFCDDANSVTSRRWIGIALRNMVRTSSLVVSHLKPLRPGLQQLGRVILRSTEWEETRILAAVIIQEAVKQGIEFPMLWPSDKVPNNAPNFPQEPSPDWMYRFQVFLDTLGKLAILQPATDPAILYPTSLMASDGYKWRDSEGVITALIVQEGLLTVILPDFSTHDLDFVDIPLRHVQRTKRRKSTLHDSQNQGTEFEPWDLIISLRPGSWTYLVNTAEHTGNEFTILFANAREAEECDSCIQEFRPRVSSSRQVLNLMISPKADKGEASSKDKEKAHSEDQTFTIDPANYEQAQNSPDNSISLQIENSNDMGATAPFERAATGEAGPGPLARTENSPATTSIDNVHSTPNVAKGKETLMVVENPQQTPLKPTLRTLPKIKKPGQRSSMTRDLPTNGNNLRDEYDFPDDSQRMTRPSMVLKEREAGTRPQVAASIPQLSLNRATKARPNDTKPKAMSKYARRQQVNNTEEEEDPITLHVLQPLPLALTDADSTIQTTQLEARSAAPEQQPKVSQSGPRSSGLPRVSKLVSKKASTTQGCSGSDPFAIPQDDEPKEQPQPDNGPKVKPRERRRTRFIQPKDQRQPDDEPKEKPRARRKAAKGVNYKDSDSSASESSESDYVVAAPPRVRHVANPATQTKGTAPKEVHPVGRLTTQTKGIAPRKALPAPAPAKSSEPKTKLVRSKAKASKADIQSVSPEKHPLLTKLLTKSQNMRTEPSRRSPTHNPRKRPEVSLSPQPDIPAPLLEPEVQTGKSQDPTSGETVLEVQTVLPPKPSTSPLDSKDRHVDQLFTEFVNYDAPLLPSEKQALQDMPVANDIAISQAIAKPTMVSTTKRKRSGEGTPPTTPMEKRTKTKYTSTRDNATQADSSAFLKAPTTVARPRVLDDPTSPLGYQRRSSALPKIQGTVHSFKASLDEHNSSPALPTVPLHQESHKLDSIKKVERRHTPLNQHVKRIHSGGSANAEILSSNSKPIPASPNAESMAISGHADKDHVNLEKEIANYETARSNPFAMPPRSKAPRPTAFIRRLTETSTGIDEERVLEPALPADRSPIRPVVAEGLESPVNVFRDKGRSRKASGALVASSKPFRVKSSDLVKTTKGSVIQASGAPKQEQGPVPLQRRSLLLKDSNFSASRQDVADTWHEVVYNHEDGDVDMDDDQTLVAQAQETPTSLKASPGLHFKSSPLGSYPSSSHSSTSAEREPESEPPVPTSEAEEMEWQESLQPHQRGIHDQLIRISKHLVRHIVDKENAVDDVADMYAQDGQHLLDTFVERHSGKFESALEQAERKKETMRKEYEHLAKRMAREREKYGPKGNGSAQG